MTIQKKQELESELTDADSYLSELEEKIMIIEEFIRKASQPPVALTHVSPIETLEASAMDNEVVKKPVHTVTEDVEVSPSITN